MTRCWSNCNGAI